MPKVTFENIAINSTAKKKPTEQDKDTYIGLEHLDPQCLEVTRFGGDVAPIGEKLLMKKGDVLFGKRRAYQKKVGIAPFDGIFSAHGLVLRPKEEVITKEFFPFFISSDYFLDKAIEISVGSLSPTINWSDLKKLEFNIPEIDKQKEYAPILWAFNDTKNKYLKLLADLNLLINSQFIEMVNNVKHEVVLLGDLEDSGRITLGRGQVISKTDIMDNKGDYPVYSSSATNNGEIGRYDKFMFDDEKITWSIDGGGKFFYRPPHKYSVTNVCGWLKVNDSNISTKYLYHALMNEWFNKVYDYLHKAHPSVIRKEYTISIPSLEDQRQFVNFIELLDKSKFEIEQALENLKKSQKSLLDEIFSSDNL